MTSGFFNSILGKTAACATFMISGLAMAQSPAVRIAGHVNDSERATLAGSRHPLATAANDAGAVPDSTTLQGMTIVFGRSAAQQAALDALLAAQQDPASPQYHQWLTADQFAAQFGMADADLNTVSSWLGTHGLQVGAISRSRDRIHFTGTAAQFASAFGAPLHYFNVNGVKHFAPATDLTLPAAFSGSILAVENVTDFRATSHVIRKGPVPAFTSSQTGNHYLTPKDLATIYDINAAYNAGYTGAGQSIAVIGQSAVVTSDITNFQAAAGVTVRAPNYVLMPGTGVSTAYTSDESESDLDLEYSSGVATGATIYFVYTGSSPNYGVSDALNYAITNQIAPIITLSYGYCEATLGQTSYNSMNASLQQAAAQGETVVNSSGDDGSTACYGTGSVTTQAALSVSYPASSQYVTGVGGTEFTAANVVSGNNTYFASGGSDIIGSAISYIPEIVWNDDSAGGISSSGGGPSIFTARPGWQAGVTGIPAGSFRLVPDVALAASPANPGYLYCSSDSSVDVTGSCAHGFRDANDTYLTVAGGTSFAAPSFAGMLAIIAQRVNSNGLGVANPTLYTLASNATTYASAFHDITSGSNACADVSTCNSTNEAGFAATTGYDQATGLGSVDLYNLLTAWPAVSSLAGSRVTLSAGSSTVALNANDVVTVTVSPALASLVAPSGTVVIKVDGSTATTLTLTNGTATYPFSNSTSGPHVITATYSGDPTYAGSSSTLAITVSAIGGFTLSAPAITIGSGNTAIETITLTPTGGYTGSVGFTVSTPSLIANTCFVLGSASVTGTTPVTTTLTISTSSSICSGYTPLVRTAGNVASLDKGSTPVRPGVPAPLGVSLAGLVAIGVLGRRSRRLRGLVVVALLAVAGFGLSGCGDGNTGNVTNLSSTVNAATGTYAVTVTATDAYTLTITASTTFNLTIQ